MFNMCFFSENRHATSAYFRQDTRLKTRQVLALGAKAVQALQENQVPWPVTTCKSVEGGPDREAPEVVWNASSYI